MTDDDRIIDLRELAERMGYDDADVGLLHLLTLFDLCDLPDSPERTAMIKQVTDEMDKHMKGDNHDG